MTRIFIPDNRIEAPELYYSEQAPTGSVIINPNHYDAKGLVGYYLMDRHNLKNVVTGDPLTFSGGTLRELSDGAEKLKINGTSGDVVKSAQMKGLAGSSEMTVICEITTTDSTPDWEHWAGQQTSASNMWSIQATGTEGQSLMLVRNGADGWLRTEPSGGGFNAGTPFTTGFTFDGTLAAASRMEPWLDGEAIVFTVQNSGFAATVPDAGDMLFGDNTLEGTIFTGNVGVCAIWNRKLSDIDNARLHNNLRPKGLLLVA